MELGRGTVGASCGIGTDRCGTPCAYVKLSALAQPGEIGKTRPFTAEILPIAPVALEFTSLEAIQVVEQMIKKAKAAFRRDRVRRAREAARLKKLRRPLKKLRRPLEK